MITRSLDDQELIARLREGSQPAFAEIYRRYAAYLMRFARKNISVKEDCEEVLQDVFTSLWERRDRVLITSLKYYLINAVRHKVMHYFEGSAVRKRYEEHHKIFEVAYASLPSIERNPGAITKAMEKIISDLPNRCQHAMRLRMNNFSYQEIATQMNITQKTVETYLTTAFEHIRSSPLRNQLDIGT